MVLTQIDLQQNPVTANPSTYVFTLFAQHIVPRDGEVWVGSLIRALETVGFRSGTVRTLVSRMQRRGYLRSRRCGRHSFYRLTTAGHKEVRWGRDRVLVPPDDEWDGKWTVVVYSVPERERQRRDALRCSLTRLGFGALAPGTWVSPRPLSPQANEAWEKLEVQEYLEVFRAKHVGPSDACALIARAWPRLSTVGEQCLAYVARYLPQLHRCQTGDMDDEECFATRLHSFCEFVPIAIDDPALPSALLPEDWPRPRAQTLLGQLQKSMSSPSRKFFDAICDVKGWSNEYRE